MNKKASNRLYTYVPKDNTVEADGLLSTVLTDDGWKKYRGRTRRNTKDAVLRILDSFEPGWKRSRAISALSSPIPDDAADDLVDFAKEHHLYSFDVDELKKAMILKHLRKMLRKNTSMEVDKPSDDIINWKRVRDSKHPLLFSGIPHYMVETSEGKIPPRMVRDEEREKKADAPSDENLRRMYDLVQADAKLDSRIGGLGFGRSGDAYRKAAAKLRVMELVDLLRDGKSIRNRIVHRPGYVPSDNDIQRAIMQYAKANAGIDRALGIKTSEPEKQNQTKG